MASANHQPHDAAADDDKHVDSGHNSDVSAHASPDAPPAGVTAMEATARAWSARGLAVAYIGLFLVQQVSYLDSYSLYSVLLPQASAFHAANYVSTVQLVQQVVLGVVKTPVARLSDVLGRFELYCLVIALYVLGYILDATAPTIQAFAAAQILYEIGFGGQQVLQQVFIADTTTLATRAVTSALPYLLAVWSAFAGPQIGNAFATSSNLRWQYGVWAICLPVAFLPLALSLWHNKRKARHRGLDVPHPFHGAGVATALKNLCIDLDALGIVLFAAFVALILLPLNLAPANGGFGNPSYIAMFAVGGVCMVLFVWWERLDKYNPKPFFPKDVFAQRTPVCGFLIAFFYFAAYYLSVYPYYNTYLQVTVGLSLTAASYVVETFTLASSPAAVAVGLLVKYTGHIKGWIVLGSATYMTAIGLMIRYRYYGTSVGSLVGLQIMVGIGGGCLNVPTQFIIQASVSHRQVAAATAIFLTVLEIGGAVGNAISGAVWNSSIPAKLDAYLPEGQKDLALSIVRSASVAKSFAQGSPVKNAIDQAYSETMQTLLIIAVCMAAPTIPLALVMRNYDVYKMDPQVAGRVIGGTEKSTDDTRASRPEHRDVSQRQRPWPLNRYSGAGSVGGRGRGE